MPHFDCDKIQFEGTSSKSALAFKHYNPDEIVGGKSMKDHLRFAAPYWHVMRNELGDPFGAGTAVMPWDDGSNSVENAVARVDVFFEFLEKIGIDFYCWHDRDIAPELGDLAASNAALDSVVAKLKSLAEALDTANFTAAHGVQMALTTGDWDECSAWLTALKRLTKFRSTFP